MGKYNSSENDDYLLNQNKLGIKTIHELEEAEKLAFFIRASQVELNEYKIQSFSKKSFKNLHYFLFQDIYFFAGKFRDVQLMKQTTRFCQVQFLETIADDLFNELQNEEEWKTIEIAAVRMAYFKSEINMLHPFREGNGRTIRIFLQKYALSKGYEWHYDNLERKEYIKAMVQSVTDPSLLEKIFIKTLEKES